MKYQRRMLAGLATAGTALALVPATTSAAAPDPTEQGVKLCLRQDGLVVTETATEYTCTTQPEQQGQVAPPFSQRDLDQAERLCNRNGGVFQVRDPQTYTCLHQG